MTIAEQTNGHENRFRDGAPAYAAYLETPEGRLRSGLALANLQEFLPAVQPPRFLRALDIGAGTGDVAVCLARLGIHVTLLDCSPEMLDLANRAAREAGAGARIALREGDASQAAALFAGACFDVIVCHNVLEFVDDPVAVLRGASHLMRESSVLSVLVRNQAGEVLKAAIQAGDLAGAERSLAAEWGRESLFGGKVRLFTPESLHAMLREASLTAMDMRGVRVLSDYLPPAISLEAEYQRIFALERKLGGRPEFRAMARYTQFLVGRTSQPEPGT
ncbi:MAG TPA: methyltransferase domain-containing protein [Candidatus Acidoferrales bacterium]|nr:methyltransferase domain-containing protein [Candidatus Acidoferrales bacterium]